MAVSTPSTIHTERDRRRQRSLRSNQKIKDAVLTQVRAGNFAPRAQDLAASSGLSLRTVFRHIEDMESVFRELVVECEQEVLPPLLAPYHATNWRARLEESFSRRVVVFEVIMPLRIAADQRRFRSTVLQQDFQRVVNLERDLLAAVLPQSVTDDNDLFQALNMVLSFNSWRRLRKEQSLDVDASQRVTRRCIDALLWDHP